MPKNSPKHYYLIAGEVHFLPNMEEGEAISMQVARLNGVIQLDSKKLTLRALGKAQTTLQMNFHQRMEDPGSYEIHNAVILSMTYMGLMTEEEYARPNSEAETQSLADSLPFISANKH